MSDKDISWRGCKVQLKKDCLVQGLKHDKPYKVLEDLDNVLELSTPVCVDSRHLRMYFELCEGEVPSESYKVIQPSSEDSPKKPNPYAIPKDVAEDHALKRDMKTLEKVVDNKVQPLAPADGVPIGYDIANKQIIYGDAPKEEVTKTTLPPSPKPAICKTPVPEETVEQEVDTICNSQGETDVLSNENIEPDKLEGFRSRLKMSKVRVENTPEGPIAVAQYELRFSVAETMDLIEESLNRRGDLFS